MNKHFSETSRYSWKEIEVVNILELIEERIVMEGLVLARFIDDLAGAIYDFFKFIFTSICYIFAGGLVVGIPLYLIALAFKIFD